MWKIWRKSKLNSEKIWNIWKISALVIITLKETSSSSLPPPPPPSPPPPTVTSSSAAAAGAAAIVFKFHPKHVTSKHKTKHIMKISHIDVNI
jgi:hypothetical protein